MKKAIGSAIAIALLPRIGFSEEKPKEEKYRTIAGYTKVDFMKAGFIYCPYIPLFTTPTCITSDLIAQKGSIRGE